MIYYILYFPIDYNTIIKGGSLLKLFSHIAPKSTPSTFTLENINSYNANYCYHNKLALFFIEGGQASFHINNETISINGPSIICLNETEQLVLTKSNNLQGKILSFSPTSIRDYFTFENIRTFDHCFSPDDINIALLLSIFFQRFSYYNGCISISEPSLKQFDKLLDQLIQATNYGYTASNMLIEILSYAKRLVQTNMSLANVIITETSFEVKDVLLYLHNNCKQKITIPILSKQFHVNRTTLSDRFFEATGETIITYLNKYRINLAAIMLRETNHSISNIAEEVGFNDTAYFAKLFKKYMLHTPSGYRQHYFSLCQVHKYDEHTPSQ